MLSLRTSLLLIGAAAGCGDVASVDRAPPTPDASIAPSPFTCDPERGAATILGDFSRRVLEAHALGPGYVGVADVNGDGRKDVVVSSLGALDSSGAGVKLSPANVAVYLQGSSLECWHRAPIVTEADAIYFANEPNLTDVDGDGDVDLIVPAGFFVCAFDRAVGNCGALVWFENVGGAWKRHDIVPRGSERFFHRAVHVDFDGDGIKDLVTVGESSAGATTLLFRGTRGADPFAAQPVELSAGLGSFPVVVDVDGDGLLDVASAEYFVTGESFAWIGRTPGGAWARHVIDDTSGRGFMLAAAPNLFGDGVMRFVGSNHVNAGDDASAQSGIFVMEPPADPTSKWKQTLVSTGVLSRPSMGMGVKGAPGVFGAGDLDGDGDSDIAVAGDGDARTFWLEQTTPGIFVTHVIEPSLGQAAGALVTDIDGDGRNEIVFTGYEDGAVRLYAHR
jgi:hypothetical protein